ncbi:MAG TPA: PAS domain S-box protein, partial [Chloroflexota bacterium]
MYSQALHFLLVEDSQADADLIHELLTETSSEVNLERVDRLASAIEHLASHAVDVVLLDLSLPDAQGLAGLTGLRNVAPSVPIVVLTGLDDELVATRAMQAGAQDYLIKGHVDGGAALLKSARYAMERQNAEQRLHESEERFRSLAEIAPVGIVELDTDDAVIYSNHQWQTISGLSAEESLGHPWERILHEEDREVAMAAFWQTRGRPRNLALEVRIVRPDASERWIDLRATSRIGRDGSIFGTVATAEDVSERKWAEQALQESEALYRAVVENLNEGISITSDGARVLVNPAYYELFGINGEAQVLGRSFLDFIVPEDR